MWDALREVLSKGTFCIYASFSENHGKHRATESTCATGNWTWRLFSTSFERRTSQPALIIKGDEVQALPPLSRENIKIRKNCETCVLSFLLQATLFEKKIKLVDIWRLIRGLQHENFWWEVLWQIVVKRNEKTPSNDLQYFVTK